MSWTVEDIPDQTGRVAVVTGANGGLGLETARALAVAGAHVVMAVRNQEKAAEALTDIRGGAPDSALELVGLDLASQASVREASKRILAAHQTLDILVNNAGVMATPERRTADGFELQLGVNHLGHYSLTALLMPALLRADAARVVSVTSTAHHFGRAVDPANPHLHGRYRPWRAYDQSKLANFHFAIGLQRRLEAAGAPTASLIAHPGLSNTDLQAVSVRETGGGLSQRSSTPWRRARGCHPPEACCHSSGRQPTRAPAAASSTRRDSSTEARPCTGRSCDGSAWTARSRGFGRCPNARPV